MDYDFSFHTVGLSADQIAELFCRIVEYVSECGGEVVRSFRVRDLTHDQAVVLFDRIITYVEECGGYVGGGFHPVTGEEEASDGEAAECQ